MIDQATTDFYSSQQLSYSDGGTSENPIKQWTEFVVAINTQWHKQITG